VVDLLAQRHGVRVDLRSEPDGASVVSIVVPASALEELPQATGLLVEAPELDEWLAPVLPLASPAAPRHRRDDATGGQTRRSG
jgi:hypothetical protein